MTLCALLDLTVCDNVYVRDELTGDCIAEGDPNHIKHIIESEDFIVESIDGGEDEYGPYIYVEVI